jgi:glucan phosphoethanolaminetransferase (alkaline phosphatase superfamily)
VNAVSLLLVLLVVRVMGIAGRDVVVSWWSPIAYLWHDAVIVLLLAAFEQCLRRRHSLARAAYVVLAAYAVVNVPVQRALGTPLTRPMWRAAGGPLADSIRHYATWGNAALVACGLAAIAVAPLIARRLAPMRVLAAVIVCAALGPAAAARVDTSGLERNAWTALAAPSFRHSSFGVRQSDDWRSIGAAPAVDASLVPLRGAAASRHVVLVSLESAGARYLGLYGAKPDVTPNLSALSQSAVVFENAYAVYPESIKGLFSVLCSMYPDVDTDAERYGEVPCESVAAVLSRRGYRTGLFHSGRFAYLGMDAIVRNRGYATLADAGDIGGQHESSFGIDETSTVAAILHWIDAQPRGAPWMVTYLPIAGHHPYETPDRGPFPEDSEFGRYRNALHYADAALGALRRGLQERGLDRDTLWIVFGDHGEAFGQHDGNYGHTFQLYEENVRVPFVVAAPGLIDRQIRARRIVSLIDTAPTTLDLLGVAPPASYEGRSMLDGTPRRALFFTDYSLRLLGFREGARKVIYDAGSERVKMFDVERDPDERVDLSERSPVECRRAVETLAAWSDSPRRRLLARAGSEGSR